jgi:glycosyltransferase involved in cell wall biosynthesis
MNDAELPTPFSMGYGSGMGANTSVIMPVRDGAAFIAEAIQSALVQLAQTDEIIVVDDHSSDRTLSVVAAIADPRVRVLSTPSPGVSAARNVGLAAARGELIAFLDHDDFWPAGRHQAMRRALAENPAVDAVFGRIRIRFEPGVAPSALYLAVDGKFPKNGSVCCGLYRRCLLDRIGGFAEDMRFGEDIDYNMRLTEAGMRIELCETDSLVYRRHALNTSNDQKALRDGFFETVRRKLARARGASRS